MRIWPPEATRVSPRQSSTSTWPGGTLSIPDDRNFCLYALQAVSPLLPAKQRMNSPADWMETDALCTCPDPNCKLIMRIGRDKVTTFRHDDVSAVTWEGPGTTS